MLPLLVLLLILFRVELAERAGVVGPLPIFIAIMVIIAVSYRLQREVLVLRQKERR